MNLINYVPTKKFAQKHLLTLADYSADDVLQILSLALKLKNKTKQRIAHPVLQDKTLGMIFTKSSTRTRVSFEVGIKQLGGSGLFLSSNDIQLGRGETIHDTAKVLSRYLDGIMIRTFAQSDVEDLAKYGSIPIINGLTDLYHPCQALADLLTIYEHKGDFQGLKLAYIGDGNNVAHSLMLACGLMGMDISIGCPVGFEPNADVTKQAEKFASSTGAVICITQDPIEAIKDADVVYADVWASMGQESESANRLTAFDGFQINQPLFNYAKENAIFMHCLPAHRGEEVTSDVIDSPASVIFDQAENRLHAQKAVMALLMDV
jgi:ornithine carbamoyltransferase